jgi:adenylyl cyclase-associated protein
MPIRDEVQIEWVKSFYALQRGLISYVRQHHAKGLEWNPKGIAVADAVKQRKAASSVAPTAPPSGRAPPPPPLPPPGSLGGPVGGPPPPPPPPGVAVSVKGASAADMGAVFSQLNQGENITSGLKKVDPSQQTHKNPSLRTTAPVPVRSNSQGSTKSIPPSTKPKPESLRTKKPARKELDGNKWIIVRIACDLLVVVEANVFRCRKISTRLQVLLRSLRRETSLF